MNKKGFTLIELLAVIVILAIIALIATPIILNIIKDTRESAGLRSAEMYLDVVEQTVSIEKMNNTKFNPSTCTIKEDGNLTCEGTNVQVEVKGEKPLKGNIVFESGKITNIRLEYKNNKIILKNKKGNLEYFDYNRNSDINFIVEGIKEQVTTKGYQLLDLSAPPKIKGFDYSFDKESGVLMFNADESYKTNRWVIPIKPNTKVYILSTHTSELQISDGITTMNIGRGKLTEFTTGEVDTLTVSIYNATTSGTFNVTGLVVSYDSNPSYELYTGGKPSPSPEYPQEIPLTGTLNPKTGKYDINVTASTEDGSKTKALTLTSPVQLTKWDKLIKKDGVWGWSIWNKSICHTKLPTIDTANEKNIRAWIGSGDIFEDGVCNILRFSGTSAGRYLSNSFTLGNNNYTHFFIWNSILESYGYVYDAEAEKVVNIANARVALSAMMEALGGITIIGKTKTEQSFIPLPEEDQNILYNLKL